MTDDVQVRVPGPDYRPDAAEAALWELAGAIIGSARHRLGDERAFSVLLSRMARELRRARGVAAAKQVLQGMVDTMDEAARYDGVSPPGSAGA